MKREQRKKGDPPRTWTKEGKLPTVTISERGKFKMTEESLRAGNVGGKTLTLPSPFEDEYLTMEHYEISLINKDNFQENNIFGNAIARKNCKYKLLLLRELFYATSY